MAGCDDCAVSPNIAGYFIWQQAPAKCVTYFTHFFAKIIFINLLLLKNDD